MSVSVCEENESETSDCGAMEGRKEIKPTREAIVGMNPIDIQPKAAYGRCPLVESGCDSGGRRDIALTQRVLPHV